MSIYREIRQVLEAVVAQEPGALEAAQSYLRQHCRGCGTRLPAEQHGGWCARCALPEIPVPARPTDAAHSADPAHWPAGKVQETVRRVWDWPEVQALLGELEQLGVTLPICDADGSPASLPQRQTLYDHPQALAAIVQARASGVGVRHLAGLLFGAAPGGYSDEISRRIKEVDPAAAAAPSRHTSAPAAPLARAHQPPSLTPPRARAPKARVEKPPRAAKPAREQKPPKATRPAAAPRQHASSSLVDPSHPAAAWPPALQAKAHALWDQPAAVQLRADLAAIGLALPLPYGADQGIILGHPAFLVALARAYRAGLGQRALAILVLGTAPGQASDDIGRLLDAFDPALREAQSPASPQRRATTAAVPSAARSDPANPSTAWRPFLQAQIRDLWDQPAVAQLRADLAALGIALPLPRDVSRYIPLGRPDVRAALASAYRAGLRERDLAALVLGAEPRYASEEIGRILDAHDPTIRSAHGRG